MTPKIVSQEVFDKYIDASAFDKGFFYVTLPDLFLSYASLKEPNKEGEFRSQFIIKKDNELARNILKEAIYQTAEMNKKGSGDVALEDLVNSKNKVKMNINKSFKHFDTSFDEDEQEEKREASKGLLDGGCIFFDAKTSNLYDTSGKIKKGLTVEHDGQKTKKPNILIAKKEGNSGVKTGTPSEYELESFCQSGLSIRVARIMFRVTEYNSNKYVGKYLDSILLTHYPKGEAIGGGEGGSDLSKYVNYDVENISEQEVQDKDLF